MFASALPASVEYLRFLPEIILSVVATLVMVIEPLTRSGKKNGLVALTLAAFTAAIVAAVFANGSPAFSTTSSIVMPRWIERSAAVETGCAAFSAWRSFRLLISESECPKELQRSLSSSENLARAISTKLRYSDLQATLFYMSGLASPVGTIL